MAASSTKVAPKPAATLFPNVHMSGLLGPAPVRDLGRDGFGQRRDAYQPALGVTDPHQVWYGRARGFVPSARDVGGNYFPVAVEVVERQPEEWSGADQQQPARRRADRAPPEQRAQAVDRRQVPAQAHQPQWGAGAGRRPARQRNDLAIHDQSADVAQSNGVGVAAHPDGEEPLDLLRRDPNRIGKASIESAGQVRGVAPAAQVAVHGAPPAASSSARQSAIRPARPNPPPNIASRVGSSRVRSTMASASSRRAVPRSSARRARKPSWRWGSAKPGASWAAARA